MLRTAIALLVLMLLASDAEAQKRVALVIGNSAYQHTGKLANPKNDASDMTAALKKHGFQVIEGLDLDKAAFDRKVRDFSAALRGAEAGLFFYAGHGLQVAGHNYLVPVDAKAETEDALDWEMLKVDVVHRAMERSTSTNILFLDACRDNPLARNLARAMGTRSSFVGRGLATIESGVGTLISFSTQPGNVALDGTGRNSPFAGSLVKHISTSNDGLSDILVSVRNDVMKETQRKQVPWEHSALTGRFYFGATPPVVEVPAPTYSAAADAARVCREVEGMSSLSMLSVLANQHKGTPGGDCVTARLAELKRDDVAKQEAAKKKTEEEERAKAEAGRKREEVEEQRRLAALKAAETAKAAKTGEEAIARQRESDKNPAKLATLPKIEKSPPAANVFDGSWTFSNTPGVACKNIPPTATITIANGRATSASSGRGLGTISSSGTLRFSVPSTVDNAAIRCVVTLRGRSGSGSCARLDGRCTITITAKQN